MYDLGRGAISEVEIQGERSLFTNFYGATGGAHREDAAQRTGGLIGDPLGPDGRTCWGNAVRT